jgi:putative oxidoreductase
VKTGIQTEAAANLGKLILRLAVGILILLHGIAKLRFGLGDVATSLQRAGIPLATGYLVYIGEVIAPTFMILGAWTRIAAAIVAFNMLVALLLGHPHELFEMTEHGGLLLEVQWLYLAGALAVAMLGAGRFSVGGLKQRWN